MISTPLDIADMFCGGGGLTTGIINACEAIGARYRIVGVNHDPKAIATGMLNHPHAHFLKTDVDRLRNGDLSGTGSLHLLFAAPSCLTHSYARGNASIDEENRVSAWAVVREAERYRPRLVLVENVAPFADWGPTEIIRDRRGRPVLDRKGNPTRRPIKGHKGETYRAWFSAMESLGYRGCRRVLNAADYGAPQSRARLITVFVADGIDWHWPAPTHDRFGANGLPVWRGWISIIDRSIASPSLYLCDPADCPSATTIERIAEGLRRYVLPNLGAAASDLETSFIVPLRNHARPLPEHEPVPTVVASSGNHLYLATATLRRIAASLEPFVLGQHGGAVARPASCPLPTVTTDGFIRVFEPRLAPAERHAGDPRPLLQDLDGGLWQFDLGYRALAVHELAGAQGFPSTYQFVGNVGDAKRQIGNAVPGELAFALATSALESIGVQRVIVAA